MRNEGVELVPSFVYGINERVTHTHDTKTPRARTSISAVELNSAWWASLPNSLLIALFRFCSCFLARSLNAGS